MAITATNIFTGSSGVNGPYTTASFTPAVGKLYVMSVEGRISSGSVQPVCSSMTSSSLTWVQVPSFTDMDAAGADRQSVYSFRTMGSGSSQTVSITFSGQTLQRACWTLDEFDGVDTSGTNGSGAIVQTAKVDDGGSSATSASVTLSAFADATNNVAYGIFGHQVQETQTVGSGFTALSNQAPLGVTSLMTEWKTGQDTTVDASWATGGRSGGIAIEIKAASTAANTLLARRDPHRGLLMRARR